MVCLPRRRPGYLLIRNSGEAASSTPSVSFNDIASTIETRLGGRIITSEPHLEYVVRQDGTLSLTYVVQVQNLRQAIWYEVFVDAHSDAGELVSVIDYVSTATVSFCALLKTIGLQFIEELLDHGSIELSQSRSPICLRNRSSYTIQRTCTLRHWVGMIQATIRL